MFACQIEVRDSRSSKDDCMDIINCISQTAILPKRAVWRSIGILISLLKRVIKKEKIQSLSHVKGFRIFIIILNSHFPFENFDNLGVVVFGWGRTTQWGYGVICLL